MSKENEDEKERGLNITSNNPVTPELPEGLETDFSNNDDELSDGTQILKDDQTNEEEVSFTYYRKITP